MSDLCKADECRELTVTPQASKSLVSVRRKCPETHPHTCMLKLTHKLTYTYTPNISVLMVL